MPTARCIAIWTRRKLQSGLKYEHNENCNMDRNMDIMETPIAIAIWTDKKQSSGLQHRNSGNCNMNCNMDTKKHQSVLRHGL